MKAFLKILLATLFAAFGAANLSAGESVAIGSSDVAESSFSYITEIFRVAALQDYNTRLVVVSTLILGAASGLIGSFMMLRKRSLMGDTLSHACLPGIGLAFILMASFGGSGKNLHGLLAGAALTGLLGVWLVMLIRNTTRIKDDTAMGIVLSVFFGAGIVMLSAAQKIPGASAAGLESFIYGKTASMVFRDFLLISGVSSAIVITSVLLFKEFTLLCFDENYAKSLGFNVGMLDILMFGLITLMVVVGLQSVGIILIIAFLIIPAAAARFWTDDLTKMLRLSALIGALSGWLGATMSALLPRLPAGAVIVITAACIFVFSMVCGGARGIFHRILARIILKRKIDNQHLLRAVYEVQEASCRENCVENIPIDFDKIEQKRSWTPAALRRIIGKARKKSDIYSFDGKTLELTESGYAEAARITRNHRLWEIFLITHADIAAAHVDRDADSVEHVLSPEMVRELESELNLRSNHPSSPHPLKN